MNNLFRIIFFVFLSATAFALTSNYTTFVDGNVLNASDLNNLQTHYTNADNAILDGDTFTGTMSLHSGADLKGFSDSGTTMKWELDGATGSFIGAIKSVGSFNNLNLDAATTTNSNDSILVECGNSACSATNPGFVVTESATTGQMTVFSVTSNVTINLTGAHWGHGTTGDVSDAIIKVFAVNNNGSLVWCVGLLGGKETLLSTDDSTTATDINLAEEVLCNAAVDSATNSVHPFGWVRANFDDTGGAAEDLWAVQTGAGDINYGNADGQWQPWNPTFTGFSANPTVGSARWTQIGQTICVNLYHSGAGTSNATTLTTKLPVKTRNRYTLPSGLAVNNGSSLTTPAAIQTTAGSVDVDVYRDMSGAAWTNVNGKKADFNFCYDAGPSASFIP